MRKKLLDLVCSHLRAILHYGMIYGLTFCRNTNSVMISKLSHIRMSPFHKKYKNRQSKINRLSGGPSGKVTEEEKLYNFQKQR